jgi:transposase-like protein
MPWKASSVMEEKLRFVFGYERDEQTMTELCQSFGIAREIGYVWQPASPSNRCKIMGREHPR